MELLPRHMSETAVSKPKTMISCSIFQNIVVCIIFACNLKFDDASTLPQFQNRGTETK